MLHGLCSAPHFCASCFCSCSCVLYFSRLMSLWLFPRPCYCHLWLLLLELLQHPPCHPRPPSPIPGLSCDSSCLSREENNLWMLHLEFGLEQCHRMEGARICFPSTIFGLSSGRVNPVSQSPSRMNPSDSGDLGDAQVTLFVRPFSLFGCKMGLPSSRSNHVSGVALLKSNSAFSQGPPEVLKAF